jgi:hypothetical protein
MRFARSAPEDLVGLAGEVDAGRVGAPAVALGDLHDGEHEAEDEVVAQLALVGGDEAEDHDLRLAVGATPDDDALLDDRLVDLALDLLHHVAERVERHDDLGRHERRAEALHDHQLEAMLPLVLGDAVGEDLGLARPDQLGQPGLDVRPVLLAKASVRM